MTTSPGRKSFVCQRPVFFAAFMNSEQEAVRTGSSAAPPARSNTHMTNIMHQGFPSRPYHLPYFVRLLLAGVS